MLREGEIGHMNESRRFRKVFMVLPEGLDDAMCYVSIDDAESTGRCDGLCFSSYPTDC